MVPSVGTVGGLALCWKKSLDIQIISSSGNFITVVVANDPSNIMWQLMGVYGRLNPLLKPDFWDSLYKIGESFNGPWFLGGDYNVIMEQKDKLGGRAFSFSSVCRFRKVIDNLGLIDLGFVGYPYT